MFPPSPSVDRLLLWPEDGGLVQRCPHKIQPRHVIVSKPSQKLETDLRWNHPNPRSVPKRRRHGRSHLDVPGSQCDLMNDPPRTGGDYPRENCKTKVPERTQNACRTSMDDGSRQGRRGTLFREGGQAQAGAWSPPRAGVKPQVHAPALARLLREHKCRAGS